MERGPSSAAAAPDLNRAYCYSAGPTMPAYMAMPPRTGGAGQGNIGGDAPKRERSAAYLARKRAYRARQREYERNAEVFKASRACPAVPPGSGDIGRAPNWSAVKIGAVTGNAALVCSLVAKYLCRAGLRASLPQGTVRSVTAKGRGARVCVRAMPAGAFTMDITSLPLIGLDDTRIYLTVQIEDEVGRTHWVRTSLQDDGQDFKGSGQACPVL